MDVAGVFVELLEARWGPFRVIFIDFRGKRALGLEFFFNYCPLSLKRLCSFATFFKQDYFWLFASLGTFVNGWTQRDVLVFEDFLLFAELFSLLLGFFFHFLPSEVKLDSFVLDF